MRKVSLPSMQADQILGKFQDYWRTLPCQSKLVHGFTAAGILPSQYIHFSSYSRIGVVGPWYINKVYHQSHYADIVKEAAEASMCLAVNEAKETEGYADNGEWVITDARHDSPPMRTTPQFRVCLEVHTGSLAYPHCLEVNTPSLRPESMSVLLKLSRKYKPEV